MKNLKKLGKSLSRKEKEQIFGGKYSLSDVMASPCAGKKCINDMDCCNVQCIEIDPNTFSGVCA